MKKIILTSTTAFLIIAATFAIDGNGREKWYGTEDNNSIKNLYYEIHGKYEWPVKKEKLINAKRLSDFISGYPTNWVTDYISVEIITTSNGKVLKSVSRNDVISPEQKNILISADIGTDIEVIVKYNYKNAVTDKAENKNIHVTMMVIPDIEAEYVGGQTQLKKYLKENVINKISETNPENFQGGKVTFFVNEKGEAVNVKISKSSGDSKTDKILLDVIHNMPKWNPAENSKGEKVKQEFEFSVGISGC